MSDLGTYAGTKTMEIVGPIFEIAKMIFAPIRECYNNYRGADEFRIILKNKWGDLETSEVGHSLYNESTTSSRKDTKARS